MELFPDFLRETMPRFGEGDGKAHVKFFLPGTQWTWYGSEFDGEDLFYGFVIGHDKEYGYFSLSELKGLSASCVVILEGKEHHFPCPVERDIFFTAEPLDKLYKEA